jgi:hypothetical protein
MTVAVRQEQSATSIELYSQELVFFGSLSEGGSGRNIDAVSGFVALRINGGISWDRQSSTDHGICSCL